MRVHQNFIEMLPIMLTTLCIGGLFLPKISMWVGFIMAGARIIYGVMYKAYGSDARVIGAVSGSLPMYLLAIATFVFAIIEVAKD